VKIDICQGQARRRPEEAAAERSRGEIRCGEQQGEIGDARWPPDSYSHGLSPKSDPWTELPVALDCILLGRNPDQRDV
jgi:hypothetical protein